MWRQQKDTMHGQLRFDCSRLTASPSPLRCLSACPSARPVLCAAAPLQEAFLRTEEKYRDDMRLLEVRLQKMGQEDRSRMDPLRNVHEQVLDTISSIQNKTARVLQDQERDLIRAFRARLADVTVELENERKKVRHGRSSHRLTDRQTGRRTHGNSGDWPSLLTQPHLIALVHSSVSFSACRTRAAVRSGSLAAAS